MKRRCCPRLQPERDLVEGVKGSRPEGSRAHYLGSRSPVWCTALGVRSDGCWSALGFDSPGFRCEIVPEKVPPDNTYAKA